MFGIKRELSPHEIELQEEWLRNNEIKKYRDADDKHEPSENPTRLVPYVGNKDAKSDLSYLQHIPHIEVIL